MTDINIPRHLPLTPDEKRLAISLARVVKATLPPDCGPHTGNLADCHAPVCIVRRQILRILEGDDM